MTRARKAERFSYLAIYKWIIIAAFLAVSGINANAATITVNSAAEIRALFAEFQAAGVDFFRTLKQEPWGARTFIVRDPDGNLLLFAGTAN